MTISSHIFVFVSYIFLFSDDELFLLPWMPSVLNNRPRIECTQFPKEDEGVPIVFCHYTQFLKNYSRILFQLVCFAVMNE